ncbi:MAG TPA: phospholipase D-like domain-containing protein [Candidatus Bathyarchaeia archaeon]|nr:phospholipase D-like domain-containing protein [Candidatus Bathyarchaeia archaeon]
MKFQKMHFFIIPVFFVQIMNMNAMENKNQVTLISPSKELQQEILQRIENLPKTGAIYTSMYVLSDKKTIDALENAQVAKKSILVSNHASNKKIAKVLPVKKIPGLHSKTIILSENRLTPLKNSKNKKKTEKNKAVAYFGSTNFTHMGFNCNKEVTFKTKDKDFIDNLHAQHNEVEEGSWPEEIGIITKIPKKTTSYSTKKKDITASFIHLTNKFSADTESIELATMSINPQLQQALLTLISNKNKTVSLLLDGSCFNSTKDWLEELYIAGKKHNNVLIYLYNIYKDKIEAIFPHIMHMKTCNIQNTTEPKKSWSMVSSGNFNNNYIDSFTIHPHDEKFSIELQQKFSAIKNESMQWKHIDTARAEIAQQPRQRNKKRKADVQPENQRPLKKCKTSLYR